MAPFSTSHYFKAFTFSILLLKTLAFDPNPLFSYAGFGKDLKFKPNVALFGNAKALNEGSGIRFSGTGRVMYKKPIKLLQGKPRQLVSFSTYFAFSVSLQNGGGALAFVMAPKGSEGDVFDQSSSSSSSGVSHRKLEAIGVEFSSASKGGSSSFNVTMNVGGSVVKISNTSIGEKKLHVWIDYEASSRRLEVRLSHHGKSRPSHPLLWHSIDLSNVLMNKKENEMFVGFSSVITKGNDSDSDSDSQACFLHSWSFVLRNFPHSMHSEPLDPKVFVKNTESSISPVAKQRSDCFLRVLAAMIFGTGCGALTAFIVLYLWTIFGNNSNNKCAVVPEESVEYRKVKIVVDKKTIEDGKK